MKLNGRTTEPSWFSTSTGRFSFSIPRTKTFLKFSCAGNNDTVTAIVDSEEPTLDLGDLVLRRSEDRLEGTVINRETRKGIAFAFISDGDDFSTVTDTQGGFALSLNPRPHELRVSAPGFLPFAIQLTDSATSLTIDLAPEVLDAGASGEYEGIGIQWDFGDAGSGLLLKALHPTGPAAQAGLRPGDELLAIDGEPAIDVEIDVLVQRMRGPAGTWVKLTLRRAGSVFDLNVQRRRLAW